MKRPSVTSVAFFVVLGFVVVSLLLPAFQPRSDHGLGGCGSHLRQIGLGIEGYTIDHRNFPLGTIPNETLPPDRRLGWGITILPFIDMVEASDKLPTDYRTLPNDDPAFLGLQTPPGIAKCPETQAPSYVAIAGLGVDATGLPTRHPRAGIFGEGRVVRASDIRDGSSTTMMVVESSTASGFWFAGGPGRVRSLDPIHKPYLGEGRQFGGIHKKGVNVLFADGSVKLVPESFDPKVFEALSTIAGGENVGEVLED